MWKRCLQVICEFLFAASHSLLYGLALSIPILLAFQTIYVDGGFSLQKWIDAAANLARWGTLLKNTLIVGTVATAVAVVVGTFLAVLSFKSKWPGRSAMVLILLLTACVPTYVISSAVFAIVDISGARQSATTAGWIHGLMYIPLASLLIGLGLLYVEPELEDAALLDHPAWAVILRISLPRAGWSIAAASMIIFWLVVTDYSVTDVLQVRTFAEEVYTQYQLWGQRVAPLVLSLPMMIILACGFYGLHRWAHVLARPLFQGHAPRSLRIVLRGRALAWAFVILMGLLLGTAGPLLNLLKHLGNLKGIRTTVQAIGPDWWHTILIAGATSVMVAAFAVSVAWLWTKSRWWRKPTSLMLLGLVSIPSPALAMTLMWYFSRRAPEWLMDSIEPIYNSLWMDVLALWLRFLPVGALIVLPAVQRVPAAVDEAAGADGAGWLARLIRLYWPECGGNAFLAGLVVLILAIGELNCVHIVSPPGIETLSKRFFSFIHTGVGTEVATVCLVSTITAAVPAVVLFWLVRKKLL